MDQRVVNTWRLKCRDTEFISFLLILRIQINVFIEYEAVKVVPELSHNPS